MLTQFIRGNFFNATQFKGMSVDFGNQQNQTRVAAEGKLRAYVMLRSRSLSYYWALCGFLLLFGALFLHS